jgi:hypothetical protein
MQKQIQQRVGRQPIDFIPADGSVRMAQSLICGLKLNIIDFVMHYGFVQAAAGGRGNRGAVEELSEANRGDHDRGRRARLSQLIKPTELCLGFYFLSC